MFIINKRRIGIILSCLLIGMFVYGYETSNKDICLDTKEVTSTPSSGKVVVIDAGHRKTR